MLVRSLRKIIESKLFKGKAIILLGPRQVGKTTLLKQIADEQTNAILFLNCDEPEVRSLLTATNLQRLKSIIGSHKIVMVDEAQRVKNIGLTLKIIIDHLPQVQLVVTGSSSLDLANEINEPLTGRKYTYYLFPFSTGELVQHTNVLKERQNLETRLIYGSYPDIVNHPGEERALLLNITESYLYKDILTLTDVRKPAHLESLLTALALQLGNEVSYNELAQTTGLNVETIERYITLLEQCFVVFRRNAFSSNMRNEIKKSKKVYFYDTGIRNAILQNFMPLNLRQDLGALWENYIIAERVKYNHNHQHFVKSYFWRTFQQQEIDLIEEHDGQIEAFEIKWNNKKRAKLPAIFAKHYEATQFTIINRENYTDFLT